MTILSAQSIRIRCAVAGMRMVEPYAERTEAHGMTYGLGPAGYDVRIAETVNLPPGGFVLASTVERFDIPRDILAMVADKSTWARNGIAVQHTVIEPGWRGHLTLEISNHSDTHVSIFSGQPIAQIIFHLLDAPTEQPYAGKYQDQQAGPQMARRGSDKPREVLAPAVPPWRSGETLRCIGARNEDHDTDVMLGDKRVGYLEWSGNLYGIGPDGNAQYVANVHDTYEAITQLRNWRKLHV